MGAWVIGRAIAAEVIEAFLNARFDNDDDTIRRVGKLHDLERNSARSPRNPFPYPIASKEIIAMSNVIDDRRRQAEHGSPGKLKTA